MFQNSSKFRVARLSHKNHAARNHFASWHSTHPPKTLKFNLFGFRVVSLSRLPIIMSSYYHFNAHQQHPTPPTATPVSHSHHGGRNRRAPRLSVSQHPHKQFRGVRSMKELTETANLMAFRSKFELVRSFDLEDDMEFCPGLLTESDLVSINSSASERSSLASNSPQGSPTQQPTQVAHSFLHSASPAFVPPSYQNHPSTLKLHQPSATRARNAIPIVNPATGITMSSPPPSVSPARMQQQAIGRRW